MNESKLEHSQREWNKDFKDSEAPSLGLTTQDRLLTLQQTETTASYRTSKANDGIHTERSASKHNSSSTTRLALLNRNFGIEIEATTAHVNASQENLSQQASELTLSVTTTPTTTTIGVGYRYSSLSRQQHLRTR